MEMASRDDMGGMVWMSDMLLQNDSNEMMLDTQADSPFFSDSPHSLDDIRSRMPLGMDGLMMFDDYDPYCDDGPKYMTTAATQTGGQTTRKIKPIKHPGLKLQTPIAYQKDTDLSVIPIQRDGMAVCEKCGAIGVKHAFYTKERRFCSLLCSREYSDLERAGQQIERPFPILNFPAMAEATEEKHIHTPPAPQEDPFCLPSPLGTKRTRPQVANTYQWKSQLSEPGFVAAPVSCFKHAPIADTWDNVTVGMKVEVENTDCDDFSESFPDSFWVATVLQIAGYNALLRYEGFGQNCSKDFWVSLCSSSVHPVGWCATRGKPLIPPKTIEDKYNDWKDFLVKRLTGARTLPSNFYNKVNDSLGARFRIGLNLEVVDKNRISQVKVATIGKIVGKRLHVIYYNTYDGFWCHEDSPLIHPVGWSRRVGHSLDAPESYMDRCQEGLWDQDDATEELFHCPQPVELSPGVRFREGMKLEAIDPLNLSSICVATIMKVLNEDYVMVRIDSYDEDASGADWFCYHSSSPCIFPAGFCQVNDITLTPPKGFNPSAFNWPSYLSEHDLETAPLALFNREIPVHGFVVGMRLEAADLMDPRLVCVGTVARVVGRLLKVHFDGWEDEYDQWLDCESPDMYPVGWSQLVGHKLEGPRAIPKPAVGPGKLGKGVKKKTRRRYKKGPNKGTSFGGGAAGVGAAKKSPVQHLAPDSPEPERVPSTREPAQATKLAQDSHEALPPECNGLPAREPEMGQEPAGPDQSLPVSSEPPIPRERTATSYINSTGSSTKLIPRLVDSTGSSEPGDLVPVEWNVFDVAQFLRVNDCAAYCDSFSRRKVDGKTLLTLTKDQIIDLTGMKVGPSLKIYDLIQQLKMKVNPAQGRMKASLKKLL